MIQTKEASMRRRASEIIHGLEIRIARLEKQSLTIQRQKSKNVTFKRKILFFISSVLKCPLRDCSTRVIDEGFDSELDSAYYLVQGTNVKNEETQFFVVADQFGNQGIEDHNKSVKEMYRFFNALTN
jgi:hypothetical protein